MNVFLENVNLNSTSGPNYFAQKLKKYLTARGVSFNDNFRYDKKLTFIQSFNDRSHLPMCLRLDGIYFNANFDCNRMNSNIKRSYDLAKGVIFQTNFNKELIFESLISKLFKIRNSAALILTKFSGSFSKMKLIFSLFSNA